MQKLLIILCLLTITAFGVPQQGQASPILDIDANGQLLGASGVLVEGNSYSVEFKDGSYNSLFGSSAFTFTTSSAAYAASSALLNTVFLDSDLGNFDTQPELIAGITFTFGEIITPYRVVSPSLYYIGAGNSSPSNPAPNDRITYASQGLIYDTNYLSSRAFALWTPTPAPVPEPSTMLLLGVGLGGLAIYRRKVKK